MAQEEDLIFSMLALASSLERDAKNLMLKAKEIRSIFAPPRSKPPKPIDIVALGRQVRCRK